MTERETFRESVFERDGNRCVICNAPAVDAHHILERKLFDNGGYDINNGASLCEECHIKAETTEVSVEDIRKAAGIEALVLPPGLNAHGVYDKWGNIVLPNGNRLPGPLFNDTGAQRALASVMHLFQSSIKYPRTFHLPWSEGLSYDDRIMPVDNPFEGQYVIVTEKMDGENTTLYCDNMHARSLDTRRHPSRDWVRSFHAMKRLVIPDGWRVCGENLFARHAIAYDDLESYFLAFSIWNQNNVCLSWAQTTAHLWLYGIRTVPVLYDGPFVDDLHDMILDKLGGRRTEGYVIRNKSQFDYRSFSVSVGKFVFSEFRNQVGDEHWMSRPVVPNGLAEGVENAC